MNENIDRSYFIMSFFKKFILIVLVFLMMFSGITNVNAEETTEETTTTTTETTKLSLEDADIVVDSYVYYTGSARTPNVTVYYGGEALVENTDYTLSYSNNVNVGLAMVTAEGINDYTDSISESFEIKLKTVSELTIKGVPETKTYTGKQICPSITVYDGSTKLTEGTDYTVSYGSNKSTGKATITITGIGKYDESVTKTFYIVPKKTSVKSISNSSDKKLTVKWSKVTGASGYQIAYRKKGSSTWKYTTTTKTSKTLSSLSRGTKYYVKVRAYKTVDGTKKYGSWSDSKTKTTLTYRQVRINKLISVAKSKLGCKYKYGAAGPTRFDCSGFTMYCYKQIGVSLPHSSYGQAKKGKKVSIKNLKVGDIVYRSHHVGIYVGNGKVIHAPYSGAKVSYTSASKFSYGRRII